MAGQRDHIGRRIDALAGAFPVFGCDVCIEWSRSVVVCLDEDGNELSREHPDVCPQCGRDVTPKREYHLVGVTPATGGAR